MRRIFLGQRRGAVCVDYNHQPSVTRKLLAINGRQLFPIPRVVERDRRRRILANHDVDRLFAEVDVHARLFIAGSLAGLQCAQNVVVADRRSLGHRLALTNIGIEGAAAAGEFHERVAHAIWSDRLISKIVVVVGSAVRNRTVRSIS